MNKKQGVIIVTLLALIVCAGVLATRLRSPLYVNGSTKSSTASSVTNNSQDSSSDYFAETKLTRDQKDSETLQTLKALVDDKNVSEENRNSAAKQYTQLAMNNSYESKIETTLKSKGYEDVICSVENSGVRIIIKGKDKLTDKETREIKDVVLNISKLTNVEIEVKQ